MSLFREQLRGEFTGIEVGTVDGFQGREKEAIVISMVRSNAQHAVGFLRCVDRACSVLQYACTVALNMRSSALVLPSGGRESR